MEKSFISKFNFFYILLITIFLNGCSDPNVTACMAVDGTPKEKFDECIEEAKNGNAQAQFIVSGLYRSGQGVKPDGKKSLEWALKSAENGYSDAISTVAFIYKAGIGNEVPVNYTEAIKWYKKDIEQGNHGSQNQIDNINETIAYEIAEAEKRKVAEADAKKKAENNAFYASLTKKADNAYVFELTCDGGFGNIVELRDCFHGTEIVAKKNDISITLGSIQIQSIFKKMYLSDDFTLDFKVSGIDANLSVIIKDPNNNVVFNERLREDEGIHAEVINGKFTHKLTR